MNKYFEWEEDGFRYKMSRGGLVFIFRTSPYIPGKKMDWYKTGRYNVPTSVAEKIFEMMDKEQVSNEDK